MLQTPRLALEPLLPAHAAHLFPALSHPALYTFLPQEPPRDLAALAARYTTLARRESPDGREGWLNWAARLPAGPYVGTVEATVHPDATADLAYFVFHEHQRQGYAREACAAVIDFLAREHGVRLVAATLDTRNAASRALVESLGFHRAATLPAADFFKGAPSDEYRYELRTRID